MVQLPPRSLEPERAPWNPQVPKRRRRGETNGPGSRDQSRSDHALRTLARVFLTVAGLVVVGASATPALALPLPFQAAAPARADAPTSTGGVFFSSGFKELEAAAAVLSAGGVVADTAALLAPTDAEAAPSSCAPAGNRPAYSLALRALTGSDGADL